MQEEFSKKLSTTQSIFAQRLKEIRGKNSQISFAQKCGIPPVTLSLYESGKRAPGIDILARICRASGVSSDYLLGITEKENESNGSEKKTTEATNASITPFSHCKDCVTVSILRDVVKELMDDARRAAEAKMK